MTEAMIGAVRQTMWANPVVVDDGKWRGIMYLSPVDVNNLCAHITVLFEEGYDGATAVAAYVRDCFESYPLNRIYSFVPAEASRSLDLYQRAGFTAEGRLIDHFYWNGHHSDACPVAVIRKDLDGRPAAAGS